VALQELRQRPLTTIYCLIAEIQIATETSRSCFHAPRMEPRVQFY